MSEALGGMQKAPSNYGIDAVYDNQNALQLEQLLHEYFQLTSISVFNGKTICFRIDDIDMALSDGYYLLEAVRKYLSSPYTVAIISGDQNLYYWIVQKKMVESLCMPIEHWQSNERIALHDERRKISRQYLDKSLPRNLRLQMLPFNDFLTENFEYVKIKIANLEISLDEIDSLMDDLCSPGVASPLFRLQIFKGGPEVGNHGQSPQAPLLKDNLRMWMQFQLCMRQVYEGYFHETPKRVSGKNKKQNLPYVEFQDVVFRFFSTFNEFEEAREMARINRLAVNKDKQLHYDAGKAIRELAMSNVFKMTSEGALPENVNGIGRSLTISEKDALKVQQPVQPVSRLLFHLFTAHGLLFDGADQYFVFSGRFLEVVFSTLEFEKTNAKTQEINEAFDEISLTRPLFAVLNQYVEPLSISFDSTDNTSTGDKDDTPAVEILEEIFSESMNLNNELSWILGELLKGSHRHSNASFFDVHLILLSMNRYLTRLNHYRARMKEKETLADYMWNAVYLLLEAVTYYEEREKVVAKKILGNNGDGLNIDETSKTAQDGSFISGMQGASHLYEIQLLPNNMSQKSSAEGVSLASLIYNHPVVKVVLENCRSEERLQIKIKFISSQDEKAEGAKKLLESVITEMDNWLKYKIGRKRNNSTIAIRDAYHLLKDTSTGKRFIEKCLENGWCEDLAIEARLSQI